MRLGRPQKAWPLLTHSPDPRVRSYLVNWLKPLGADPKAMMAGLESLDRDKAPTPSKGQSRMEAILFHPEISMRRALILALGQYVQKELSPGDRELLTSKLLDLYETDPDAGIHGVAEWTLRRWGHQDRLKKRDDELMKVKDWGDRRWYVNGQGQTFAVIEGPVDSYGLAADRSGSSGSARRRASPSQAHPPPVRHRRQGGDGRAVSGVRKRELGGRSYMEKQTQSRPRWPEERGNLVSRRRLLQLAEPEGGPAGVLRAKQTR